MWKRRARTRGEHPEGNLKIASAHCLTVLSGEVMKDDQGFLFDFHDLVHWATCEISMILVVCVVLGKCLFKSRCARHHGQHNTFNKPLEQTCATSPANWSISTYLCIKKQNSKCAARVLFC